MGDVYHVKNEDYLLEDFMIRFFNRTLSMYALLWSMVGVNSHAVPEIVKCLVSIKPCFKQVLLSFGILPHCFFFWHSCLVLSCFPNVKNDGFYKRKGFGKDVPLFQNMNLVPF